jgi:hypothetical protein
LYCFSTTIGLFPRKCIPHVALFNIIFSGVCPFKFIIVFLPMVHHLLWCRNSHGIFCGQCCGSESERIRKNFGRILIQKKFGFGSWHCCKFFLNRRINTWKRKK